MKKINKPKLPRTHRVSLMFNDEEYKTIEHYIRKYKIQNKSQWYREIIVTHVLKTLVADYPTLFEENDMR